MPRKTTKRIIDADEPPEKVLDTLIEQALASPGLSKLSARIRRAQQKLRGVVDPDAWRRYLAVEEVANERLDIALTATARAAYAAGLQAGRGRRP